MILNSVIEKGRKGDFAEEALKLIDKIEKILGSSWQSSSYEMLRNIAHSPDSKWAHYAERIIREVDPRILKTFLLNAGYEAGFRGYKTSLEMEEKYGCNIPWIILMDPTTACNMHCTGCWAAEYGNRLKDVYKRQGCILLCRGILLHEADMLMTLRFVTLPLSTGRGRRTNTVSPGLTASSFIRNSWRIWM